MKFAFFTLTLAPLDDENMNSELCFNQNKKIAGVVRYCTRESWWKMLVAPFFDCITLPSRHEMCKKQRSKQFNNIYCASTAYRFMQFTHRGLNY